MVSRPFVILSVLLILGIGMFCILLRSSGKSLSYAALNNSYTTKEALEREALSSVILNTNGTGREGVSFNYSPEKPINGTLKGVVEVGATGFNSFVINIDREKRWKIVAKDFGSSLLYEGLTTSEDIKAGINSYISKMFDNAVRKNDVHFVISSGAQKSGKVKSILAELQKQGFIIHIIAPDEEARYGLLAAVPPSFHDKSFMVDIGSGNTKIAWAAGPDIHTSEAPGSKYYETKLDNSIVYHDVKQKIAAIPINQQKVCFILGGIPYLMANLHRNGEERYTVLYNYRNYNSANKRAASGLNIYKAVADGSKSDMFVFDWDANFSIGYLLSLE